MHSLRALWAKISGDGWRRIAFINTIAVTVFTLFVIILLAWSTSQSRGLDSNLIFFNGDCARSAALNLWLHLLLNTCSTGVIASSNFFMQVLSSPTRSEVDKVHRKEEKLAIGVPSLSNLFHVSPFKGVCWLLFFASSFPIHLFFNSAIFATKYKGTGFHLSIAAEGFIDGAQYLGPGAVLWRAGAPGTEPAISPDDGTGYGSAVNVTQYFDPGSEVARNIEFAARSARRWQRLDVPECLSQYMYCNSHDTMRDVVWVVKSHNSSGNFMNPGNSSLGWRSFDVLATMGLVDAAFWNDLVPRKANNSLWFAANCSTAVFFKKDTQTIEGCSQSCSSAMGSSVAKLDSRPAESIPSSYTFDFFPGLDGYTEEELSQVYWPGLIDQSAATLDLQYCLAEEISTTCKVGLSNKILLVVLVCLLVKTTLCVAVLFIMPAKDPLVVPGDAVASFICSADKFTAGWCTLDSKRESERSIARICAAGKATPVQWHAAPFRRWASAIPRLVWVRSYGLFITDILFVGIMFGVAQKSSPLGSR